MLNLRLFMTLQILIFEIKSSRSQFDICILVISRLEEQCLVSRKKNLKISDFSNFFKHLVIFMIRKIPCFFTSASIGIIYVEL